MRRLSVRAVAAGATLLAALALPAVSSAAPTWLPGSSLGNRSLVVYDTDVNDSGDALAVSVDSTATPAVVVNSRAAQGGWSDPLTVSAVGQSSSYPRAAVGADGTLAVVWVVTSGTTTQVVGAVRPPGAAWTQPELLSGAAIAAGDPQVDVDGAGTVIVVFDDGTRIQSTMRRAGGGWAPPTRISGEGTATAPSLGVSASGHAVAAWQHSATGTTYSVAASVRAPGGAFTPPTQLMTPQGAGQIMTSTAVNAAGDAVIGVSRLVDNVRTVQAFTRRGGAWLPAQTLSTMPADVDDVAIGDDGTVVVPMLLNDGTTRYVVAATRGADGIWAAPATLAATSSADLPFASVDAGGNAVVAWRGAVGNFQVAQSASRPAGGGWGGAQNPPPPGQSMATLSYAGAPAGDGVISWSGPAGTGSRAYAAGLDGAGPRIADLSIPATGAVGKAWTASASVSDGWSQVASIAWNFGDGRPGTGASAAHTWTTPGTHTVTLTATDAVGNTSVRTAQVEVVGKARVLGFSLKPRTLRLRGTRAQTRTRARIRLSTAAKVAVTFTPVKARGAKGKKKKPKVFATITKNLRGGTNKLTITAKVGKKKRLKPGRYVVAVRATTAAGRSNTKKVTLRVRP